MRKTTEQDGWNRSGMVTQTDWVILSVGLSFPKQTHKVLTVSSLQANKYPYPI